MDWAFGEFVLSQDRAELVGPDGPVPIEKQPLELLFLLAGNADRVVTKDEICDVVWQGRIVSEATIATAVKLARRAVGDSGGRQAVIKTIHGRGFRFVAVLKPTVEPVVQAVLSAPEAEPVGTAKPTIAVLRFLFIGGGAPGPAIADAIPAEIITSLSRLKWARIIARGSSFRFTPDAIEPVDIGRQLGARYLVTGAVESIGDMLTVTVELVLADSGEIIWSDRFATTLGDIQIARREIVASVLSAMEIELPRYEADAAQRLDSRQFDAWSHYHLGLRHVYRFNQADNVIAADYFAHALELDPDFCRAHAGQSLTYWQQAFMLFGDDREQSLSLAIDSAERALEIDGQDPFANFNMGRAAWLQGEALSGLPWFERALRVNPNYAQCYYSKGVNQLLSGQTHEARESAKQAMDLSPLDPLHYAMLSVTAMSHFSDENFETAAGIADRAASSPGSHFYVAWIAAIALELSGNREGAMRRLAQVRAGRSELSQAVFFKAFPFAEPGVRSMVAGAMSRLGVD